MKQRLLKSLGVSVPQIALGTVELGLPYGLGEHGHQKPTLEQAQRLVDAALDMGVRFIDTARAYGDSEEVLGRCLAGRRDELVITTKVGPLALEGKSDSELAAEITASVEQSLRALRMDHVEWLMLHSATLTHIEQYERFVAPMQALRDAGKIRAFGASIYDDALLTALDTNAIACLQVAASAIDRRVETELALRQPDGKDFVIRSVLLRGALSERYRTLPDSMKPLRDAIAELDALAAQAGVSLTELAYRYAAQFDGLMLVGTASVEELQQAIGFVKQGPLSADVTAAIRAMDTLEDRLVSPPKWPAFKRGMDYRSISEGPMRIEDLETPALCVDLDVLESNLARMGSYVKQHGLKLRPHSKTHKTPEIARMQLASGAYGVTVAKSTEAAVMAEAGIDHLLLAYPAYGAQKLQRLTEIARKGTHLTIAIDDASTLEPLAAAAHAAGVRFDILAELNVGMNRVGLAEPKDILALAQKIDGTPGARFAGLNLYPGHIWASGEEQLALLRQVDEHATAVIALLAGSGLACEVVSGGSTPTAFESHHVRSLTEIRPGTYVYNDRNTMDVGACTLDDCALRVLVTVVSTAVDGWIVIDAGTKTMSSDRLISGAQSFHGLVVEDPGMQLERLSEEHGQINLENATTQPKIGDRLSIVPNHVCATVNMHDRVWYHRNGEVLGSWTVAARGCVR